MRQPSETTGKDRSLFEGLPDALFVCEPGGEVVDANPKALQLMGKSLEELLGHRLNDLLGITLDGVLTDCMVMESPFYGSSKRLEGGMAEIHFKHYETEGKPRVLATVRDVSFLERRIVELKQQQAFADRLIQSASVMIISLDRQGRVGMLNDAACRILGYSREELVGQDWFEIVVPRNVYPSVFEMFQRGLLGKLERDFENEVITKGGGRRIIAWQNSVVKDGDKIQSMVSVGTDVTERVAERERRHQIERKMLDAQKLESLGVLAGGIAHDFNNLLTAVLGNASLMRLSLPADSPHRQHLIEIERTALQAAGLCKQMLAYAGHHSVAISPLDINEVILDMRQLLKVSVGKKVALEIEIGKELPQIEADDAQLRQVVLNLIINASEAMGEKSGTVQVRTRLRKVKPGELDNARFFTPGSEGDFVELEVADDGCGMNAETQEKIFDPFFTTKFTGRGLGLASVLGIVRSHSGILDISSRENEGTRFTVLFPASKASPVATAPASPERHLVDWLGSGKVLVVEDEEGVRMFAMRLLELLGFECIPAEDGRDGLDKYLRHENELRAVLLDLTMPRMNGAEVHAAIRAVNPEMPILLVSGYTSAAGATLDDPHTDFLQKPYQLSDLRLKMEQLLKIVP
ncbi:MAG: PAS domain S-box protein [Chthoniobacteraceae bacterium]